MHGHYTVPSRRPADRQPVLMGGLSSRLERGDISRTLLARDPTVRAQTARSGSATPAARLFHLRGVRSKFHKSERDAGKGAAVRSVLNNCLVSRRLRRRQNRYHRTSLRDRPLLSDSKRRKGEGLQMPRLSSGAQRHERCPRQSLPVSADARPPEVLQPSAFTSARPEASLRVVANATQD